MHDEIHIVEEHPSALLQSFGRGGAVSLFVQLIDDVLGYAANMGVGRTGRHYEIVGHVGDAVQIQHEIGRARGRERV